MAITPSQTASEDPRDKKNSINLPVMTNLKKKHPKKRKKKGELMLMCFQTLTKVGQKLLLFIFAFSDLC